MKRYPIIDALRFCLAFWVVMGHSWGIFPLFAGVDTGTHLGRILSRGWESLVFGTPAVIVFFVISGFCIHLPLKDLEHLSVPRFYLRRYLRILIPVIAALALTRYVKGSLDLFGPNTVLWHSVLWSVLCEEVYYALYPMIRIIRRRYGWKALLTVSWVISESIALTHWHAPDWYAIGPISTAFLLFPVWLLGCILAEQVQSLPPITSARTIWMWRGIAWLACWTSGMLSFHAGISKTQTLSWFGIVFYFWIKKELQYGASRPPLGVLISAGGWSYSLYLVHENMVDLLVRHPIPNLGFILNWFLNYAIILLGCYVFARLIEFPSHQLARKVRMVPAAVEQPRVLQS